MKRRGHFFKGQMAVVMTFAIATLLGAMALGTDVAVMYFNWVQMQKGADAAALAGAFYLIPANVSQYPIASVAAGCTTQPDAASKAACTYAYNNNMAIDSNNLKIAENVASLPASTQPNIQVWVNRPNLPYLFGKVIGLNTYSVSAIATGQDQYVGSYSGPLFPIVFQCSGTCPGLGSIGSGFAESFGTKFVGTVGGTGTANGNWQFLDPGATGANALGNAIAGGLTMGDVSMGSDITTKPGVSAGPVNAGWTTRMNEHNTLCSAGSLAPENCSDPSSVCTTAASGTKVPSNDPLLVTLPVADVSACNGACSVPITGFAQVYLYNLQQLSGAICGSGVGSCYNISGCFVQQTDPNGGGGVAGAPNLGAIAPASLIQ
jgi:putative Flp pilus-assembly TadE/G-like protein